MGESRDTNDPRDQMRAMRKEAQAEFEGEQIHDTGGQEHASREDREGIPADRRPREAASGGGGHATRDASPQGPGEDPDGDRGR